MKYISSVLLIAFLYLPLFAQEDKKTLIVPYLSLSEKKSDLYIPSIFASGKKGAVAKVYVDSSGVIKAGLVDGAGKFIVKPTYKGFGEFKHGFIPLLKKNGKTDFFSIKLKKNIEENSDEYDIVAPNILITSDNFRWGAAIIQNGSIETIQNIYKYAEFDSSENNIRVLNFDTWRLLSKEGAASEKMFIYDSLVFENEKHFLFYRNNKIGRASIEKGELIPAGEIIWKELKPTQCDWTSFENNIHSDYQILFSLGLYKRDSTGRVLFTFDQHTYQSYQKAGNGLVKVKGKNGLGLIDTVGNILIPAIYDSIRGPFRDDKIFIAYKGKQVSIFDEKGNLLSEPHERGKIYDFVEGRARFEKDGYIGFIDVRGNIRVAPQYKEIRNFKEGLSAVVLKGKWCFIDKDENIIVQPLYDEVMDFEKGIAAVRKGKDWFFLDKKGGRTSVSSYDSVSLTTNGKWIVYRSGKKGLVSSSGKELLAPRYEYLEDIKEDLVIVDKSGKWGVIDYSENFVIPLVYDHVKYCKPLDKFLVKESGKEVRFSLGENLNNDK